jgi:hypothetical protein
MTNIKIKPSQVTKPPKIRISPTSNLQDVLKPEHFEIANVYDLQPDGQLGTPPADTPPEQSYTPVDPETLDGEDPAISDKHQYVAPDLADIISAVPTKYTDLNGVDKVKVVFTIKNHVGSAVVGVKGYGG